jgi:starch-binding outer membrane protein, SusD/RagB family
MKKYRIITCVFLVSAMLISNSCSDILEEKPQSNVVPSTLRTASGLLGGITGVYSGLRGRGQEGFPVRQFLGTDEYLLATSSSASAQHFANFSGIVSTDLNGEFGFYTAINTLNGIFEIAPSIPESELSAANLSIYLGHAYFLRAFHYFYLVTMFGDIPLHTTFITTPSQADTRAPANDVYALIVSDLTEAMTRLPAKPAAPFTGKTATAATAKWLLSKVYLTRGWLNESQEDFTLAYNTAKELIDNKGLYDLDLWQDYADAFKPANDYGKETLLVVDHSSDPKYGGFVVGGAGGNSENLLPWLGLFNGPSEIGANGTKNSSGGYSKAGSTSTLQRDLQFGRPFSRYRTNMPPLTAGPNAGKSYLLDQAFADRRNDSRFDKTYQTVWLSNSPSSGGGSVVVLGTYTGNGVTTSRGTLRNGIDTAVWFADRDIPGAPGAIGSRPFKGQVITPSMQTATVFPYVKKFADPNRPSTQDPSTRPIVLARFAEVYMIAAEAAFKRGDLQAAADMINVIRRRGAYRTGAAYAPGGVMGTNFPSTMVGDPYPAGVTAASALAAVTITSADVTLDFILDEYTREFHGEALRYFDLARTKSLVRRVRAWSTPTAAANVADHHMLRPIPQDQIDRVTAGPCQGSDCWQNPGY